MITDKCPIKKSAAYNNESTVVNKRKVVFKKPSSFCSWKKNAQNATICSKNTFFGKRSSLRSQIFLTFNTYITFRIHITNLSGHPVKIESLFVGKK